MKYFQIFALQCKLELMSMAIYRANFIIWLIQGTINSLFGVICVSFIYGSVDSIAGWNKQEMLILICTANIISNIFWSFIRPNQSRFLQGILNGGFDRMITKPLNLMFQINIGAVNIISLMFGLAVQLIILCVQIWHLEMRIGIIQILLYIIFIFMGVIIFASFQLLLYSLAFLFIKADGLDNIVYAIGSISDKPKEIFSNKYIRNFFIFIFPAIPVVNAPVTALLQKSSIFEMLCYLSVGIIFPALAFTAVRLGMRRYNSASS